MSTPWRRKRLFGAANNSSKAAQSQMDPDFNSLERIAAMQAALDGVKESAGKAEGASSESLARVERKVDDMVPRREFDSRAERKRIK